LQSRHAFGGVISGHERTGYGYEVGR